MTRPATPAATQSTGWADDRLMQAYDLIGAARLDAHNAGLFAVYEALKRAEDAVEKADIALEEERAAWRPRTRRA